MQFILPELPYSYDALAPYISRSTLELHHSRHHRTYLENARALAKKVRMADEPLERIIRETAGKDSHHALFNNAAQAWNHAFYWRSLVPGGGGAPKGEIGRRIDADFGSYDAFAEELKTAATSQFGSGWAWLVLDGRRLRILQTSNADTPLAHGLIPLLTIDVWEHAYYLDYQNRRPHYAAALVEHLINWDFAEVNLGRRRSALRIHELTEDAVLIPGG
jgi:Fe-Mn family superoxide dismutase